MAGGSKRVPKSDPESKSKGESQEQKDESNPDAGSSTKTDSKGKGKKPMSPNKKSPMEAAKKGRNKGIVIGEAKEPESGTVVKSGVKRKREFAVNSSYSLRSGLKGTGVDVGQRKVGRKSAVRKVKGEKKKEKESDEVLEEGSSCKRQSKRLKRNDDDKDKDGDGSKTKRALRIRAENN